MGVDERGRRDGDVFGVCRVWDGAGLSGREMGVPCVGRRWSGREMGVSGCG